MHVILAYLCGYVSVWIYVSVYKNQDRLQEEGGDYTPRFIVESLMCCMWRSRSRFSFKKHIKRITIHSSQLQYSNTCLPAKVWVQTAHYAHHSLAWLRLEEDLGTCSIFCESTPQRRTVLSLCWAKWEQVPAHMSTMNSGREGGGGGPQSRVFNMWGRVGAVVLWLHLVLANWMTSLSSLCSRPIGSWVAQLCPRFWHRFW